MTVEQTLPRGAGQDDAPEQPLIQNALSTQVLTWAADEARKKISSIRAEICRLTHELAAAQEEEKLLAKLLSIRRGDSIVEAEKAECRGSKILAPPDATVLSSNNAVDEVVNDLASANRPMHISELMRLLKERNVRIPGAGTQANLISRMCRDKRIVRPSRGMYALVSLGLENMVARPKRRRRRRTRMSKRSPSPAA